MKLARKWIVRLLPVIVVDDCEREEKALVCIMVSYANGSEINFYL